MTGFYYLGSPYSKFPLGLDAAFGAVVQARGLLVRAGVPCFSPIIHSHPVATQCDIDPLDHSIWLPAERPILDAAYGLIVLQLEGWGTSIGLSHEIKLFRDAAKPIIFMIPGIVPDVLREGAFSQ